MEQPGQNPFQRMASSDTAPQMDIEHLWVLYLDLTFAGMETYTTSLTGFLIPS